MSWNKRSVTYLETSVIPCCSVSFDMFSNMKYNKNALESERFGRDDEGGADAVPRFNKLLAKDVGRKGDSTPPLTPPPPIPTPPIGSKLSVLKGKSKDPRKVNPEFGSSVVEEEVSVSEFGSNSLSNGERFLGAPSYGGFRWEAWESDRLG